MQEFDAVELDLVVIGGGALDGDRAGAHAGGGEFSCLAACGTGFLGVVLTDDAGEGALQVSVRIGTDAGASAHVVLDGLGEEVGQ